MKILFIVPYVPSLIRVRPYNLIRALFRRGHRITLLTLWTTPQEQAQLKELELLCERVVGLHLGRSRSLINSLAVLPSSQPLQAAYCWHPELARTALSLIQESQAGDPFGVVHVEHLRGARYALHLLSAGRSNGGLPPVVWDSVDSISLLFRQASARSSKLTSRMLTRLELGRTEKYEGWLINQLGQVLVTSPADQKALLDLAGALAVAEQRVKVLPNGVDLTYFSPGADGDRQADTLVISGKMSYHANVSMTLHLVNNILPLIWQQRPQVRVKVVGKDPPRQLLALAQNPAIEVTGTVDDLRPYLQEAAVAVVPITYGAGIQNKILEAMACATPVVSSSHSAAALQAVPGQDLLVAGDAEAFARAVLCLLEEPERRLQVGQAGRRYVETYHDWDKIAAALETTYSEAAEGQKLIQTSNK
jgi:polysaccharide biosynthesis protein PslH